MCGRLTQYRGIHDFVAALSMPNALANSVGDEPIRRHTFLLLATDARHDLAHSKTWCD